MPTRRQPRTTPRKQPKQERSTRLVADVLQAAIRVLEREGAAAFTTVRVAAEAGVSVGSLYQYFPNKESILFRLQEDEWKTTGSLLDGILADTSRSPVERLRAALVAFFRSEHEEAPLRRALGDAAPLYRDSKAARDRRGRGYPLVDAAIAAAAPKLSAGQRARAVELYAAVLSALGKRVSEDARSRIEVDAWAETVADMYLAWLRAPGSSASPRSAGSGSR